MKILYLIPSPITEESTQNIPRHTIDIIHTCTTYITERARTTRRYIKSTQPPYEISSLDIVEIDKHSDTVLSRDIQDLLDRSEVVGLLSEAGLPCIADPGEEIVMYARNTGYTIKPLSGPSSIFLALMASGLNGERFSFHSYLPQKSNDLASALIQLEQKAKKERATQIFIETPYRNQKVLDQMISSLHDITTISIALDILGTNEVIITKSRKEWKKEKIKLEKAPCIFMIGV